MKLEPCPFCHETEELKITRDDDIIRNGSYDYRVRCGWCDAMGGACSTEKSAIEVWNNRTPHDMEKP